MIDISLLTESRAAGEHGADTLTPAGRFAELHVKLKKKWIDWDKQTSRRNMSCGVNDVKNYDLNYIKSIFAFFFIPSCLFTDWSA